MGICVHSTLFAIERTTFPYKYIDWASPNHATVNQIDHIFITKPHRWSLQDIRVYREANVASDDHLFQLN